jgi:DegV family protein with EDD domain
LKRGAAATGRNHVGVVDLEARALQPFDVVDLGAEDELHADLVDDDGYTIDLEDVIVVFGLIEGEGILETRAASTPYGDAEGLSSGALLRAEQLGDLAGSLVGEADRGLSLVSHFTKCSERSVRESSCLSSPVPTAVVCDTTAYLPSELIASRGIKTISLYVAVDGDQERESEIDDYADFYERLRASESGATTSQPSIGDFLSVYEPLLDEGREIVSIHISAGISGTCEAAGQARERLIAEGRGGERLHLFDSRSAAGGMGLSVLAAAAAAAAGDDAEAVLARARQAREELKMWFAIDTLEYLRRGGRIGGARAWIGSALKIKPILTLEEEITPVERVRTRARSIERLRDYARQRHESGIDGWVVQHIQDDDTAAALIEDGREIFGCEPVFTSEIGAVLGAHVGPGLLGIGSVSKDVLS